MFVRFVAMFMTLQKATPMVASLQEQRLRIFQTTGFALCVV